MRDGRPVIPRASRPFESPMTLAVRNSRAPVAPDPSLRPARADEAEADPAQAVAADPSVIDAERHPLYGHGVDHGEVLFYTGTHMPSQSWFDLNVPLFVSRVRLAKRKTLPRASAPWALDSAGFTALHTGGYPLTVDQYADEVTRYADEIGNLQWAAAMDYMCEPSVVAKTGLTVRRHQEITLSNFLQLRERIGTLAAPVLQGWEDGDHERHADMYEAAGVDLKDERIVGVGSVCRRNQDAAISRIVRPLAARGLRLHGFGVRTRALAALADVLTSADSMAWSSRGRRMSLPGCSGHRSEANCRRWAMIWRDAQLISCAQLRFA